MIYFLIILSTISQSIISISLIDDGALTSDNILSITSHYRRFLVLMFNMPHKDVIWSSLVACSFFLYFFYHALKCLHIFLAKYLPEYCTPTCLVNLVVNPGCRNLWLFKVQLYERAHMEIDFTIL